LSIEEKEKELADAQRRREKTEFLQNEVNVTKEELRIVQEELEATRKIVTELKEDANSLKALADGLSEEIAVIQRSVHESALRIARGLET